MSPEQAEGLEVEAACYEKTLPTQDRLEALAAEKLGKEAALFVTSLIHANKILLRFLLRQKKALAHIQSSWPT